MMPPKSHHSLYYGIFVQFNTILTTKIDYAYTVAPPRDVVYTYDVALGESEFYITLNYIRYIINKRATGTRVNIDHRLADFPDPDTSLNVVAMCVGGGTFGREAFRCCYMCIYDIISSLCVKVIDLE